MEEVTLLMGYLPEWYSHVRTTVKEADIDSKPALELAGWTLWKDGKAKQYNMEKNKLWR